MTAPQQPHWDQVYTTRAAAEVSWYEALPGTWLAEELREAGYREVTVLDISGEARRRQRERLGHRAVVPSFIEQDVTRFRAPRAYALWHDRAAFHFLVQAEDRQRYVEALRAALRPHGQAIIATFGPSGPERCSGLDVRRYDAAALAAELGGGFELAESSLAVHRTPKGAEQQFLYCRFARRA